MDGLSEREMVNEGLATNNKDGNSLTERYRDARGIRENTTRRESTEAISEMIHRRGSELPQRRDARFDVWHS